MSIYIYLALASGLPATVYGTNGEMFCGSNKKPMPCVEGAITASGDIFDPDIPSLALFAPSELRIPKDFWIGIRTRTSRCHKIKLNDKGAERFIGERGFDLSPSAVQLLTGRWPFNGSWKERIWLCSPKKQKSVDRLFYLDLNKNLLYYH